MWLRVLKYSMELAVLVLVVLHHQLTVYCTILLPTIHTPYTHWSVCVFRTTGWYSRHHDRRGGLFASTWDDYTRNQNWYGTLYTTNCYPMSLFYNCHWLSPRSFQFTVSQHYGSSPWCMGTPRVADLRVVGWMLRRIFNYSNCQATTVAKELHFGFNGLCQCHGYVDCSRNRCFCLLLLLLLLLLFLWLKSTKNSHFVITPHRHAHYTSRCDWPQLCTSW
jgi:hypothetical protein